MKIKPGFGVLADIDFASHGLSPFDLVGGQLVEETLPDGTKQNYLLAKGKKVPINNPQPAEK